MSERIGVIGSIDCRGAGHGRKLMEVNSVSITKIITSSGNLSYVDVGCSFLRRGKLRCSLSGIVCPHLRPVSDI